MRITEVLYRLRIFIIPYLIIICTCLIIKLTYSREDIYFEINSLHSDFADVFFTYATDLGAGISIIILTIIFLLLNYRKAFLLISSFTLTSLLAQLIKYTFHSPRPYLYFKADLSRIYLVKGIYMLTTNSFPSGHTVEAFTIATVLAYVTPNKRWGFIFLILAICVGYSRMYLSEHFFEDVTAGSIIGTMATIMWLTFIDSQPFLRQPKWSKGILNRDRV